MSTPHNPFETPSTELAVAASSEPYAIEDERLRRALLNHEVSIQAVGRLMILGGGIATLAGLSILVAAVAGELREAAPVIGLTAAYLGLGVGSLWVGNQLRTLDPRGRIPGALINGFGLVGFPVGTLISAYILYLLLSEKGRQVLSREYLQDADRPHRGAHALGVRGGRGAVRDAGLSSGRGPIAGAPSRPRDRRASASSFVHGPP